MDLLSMIIESRNRFTPLSLSPALWLDASDATTLYDATVGGNLVAAGGNIARWEDRSGNNRHVIQATATNRPLRTVAGQNGRDVVTFDGINDALSHQSSFLNALSGMTIFSVHKFALNSSNQGTIFSYAQSVVYTNDILYAQQPPNSRFLQINNGADGSVNFTAPAPSEFVLETIAFDGSQAVDINRINIFQNASRVSSSSSYTIPSTTGSPSNPSFMVGSYFAAPGTWYLNGKIAEILVFRTALSEFQRKQVENYLSSKWGIPTYDSDALDYFTRVEAVSSTINADNKNAINQFIVGCKEDGNWTSIKASCILAGADTLSGALVPLVGTAPTNVGFLSGDYSTTGGLISNGTTKYLKSGRFGTSDPLNNQSLAVYHPRAGGSYNQTIGCGRATNASSIGQGYIYSQTSTITTGTTISVGLMGISRSLSGSYLYRSNRANTPIVRDSTGRTSDEVFVFACSIGVSLNDGVTTTWPISFYSIGESINLALLDTRLAKLMNSLRPTYDVTALDYFARVEAAGSTISNSNRSAVNTLFLTLKEQSIWSLISELYLFAGVDDLTGCLVKAKGSGSLTNTGFLSGDHDRTTGLLGNGSSKYLNTGLANNALNGTSNHIFVEGSGFETSGDIIPVGVYNGNVPNIFTLDFYAAYITGRAFRSAAGGTVGSVPIITTGLITSGSFCGTRTSSTSASIYQNGSLSNKNTTSASPAFSTRPIFVFALNNVGSPTGYTAARLRAVSIGSGLSDAQVSSLHTAISTYMSSLL